MIGGNRIAMSLEALAASSVANCVMMRYLPLPSYLQQAVEKGFIFVSTIGVSSSTQLMRMMMRGDQFEGGSSAQ
jgi:hypothetical protein